MYQDDQNKTKKIPIIISINAKKKGQIPYPFMIKQTRTRNRKEFSQPDKEHIGKTHSQNHA
jgi:hypothetical protein